MARQRNTRPFQVGDRIIYGGQFIGVLTEQTNSYNPHWRVAWEDGAEGTVYPEHSMVYANGGPTSAQLKPPTPTQRDAEVYAAALEDAASALESEQRIQWNGNARKVSNWGRAASFVRRLRNPYRQATDTSE